MTGKREAKRKRHPVRTVLLLLLVLLIAGTGAFGIYVGQYYHADEEALAVLAAESDGTGITAEQMPDGSIVFVPETPVAGLIHRCRRPHLN